MLFWIYYIIAAYILFLLIKELFNEKDFKVQIAIAISLIPFILRIFLIK